MLFKVLEATTVEVPEDMEDLEAGATFNKIS